jgi:hypothetical protein
MALKSYLEKVSFWRACTAHIIEEVREEIKD